VKKSGFGAMKPGVFERCKKRGFWTSRKNFFCNGWEEVDFYWRENGARTVEACQVFASMCEAPAIGLSLERITYRG
jgi:hypothetical protein